MHDVFGANPFSILPHLVALVAAYLLALPIGWNRERQERSAGMRTFPLVAVASCGFIQASESMAAGNPEAMARVVEGIITGTGFIGGGAILRMKDSVRGTATAASLWATGAIGTAVGLGSYDVAIVLSCATFVTLWVLSPHKPAPANDAQHGPGNERESRALTRLAGFRRARCRAGPSSGTPRGT